MLDSHVTRCQAAQQMVLALLHKKAEEDDKVSKEGEKYVVKGLSHQELFNLSEVEFPERPFPAPPEHPQRLGKKGRVLPSPPTQPRPGHAIHSMKYLKLVVLPGLVDRKLIRKAHYQRPPATDFETQRLYKRAKRMARRGTLLKGQPNAPPASEVQAAEGQLAKTTLVDVWRWELVPEEDRLEWEERQAVAARLEAEASTRLREDGRPERAPYGPGRLDHLNDRRKAQRLEEEAKIKQEVKTQVFSSPGRSFAGGLTSANYSLRGGPPRGPRKKEFDWQAIGGEEVDTRLLTPVGGRTPIVPPTGKPDKRTIQAARRVEKAKKDRIRRSS